MHLRLTNRENEHFVNAEVYGITNDTGGCNKNYETSLKYVIFSMHWSTSAYCIMYRSTCCMCVDSTQLGELPPQAGRYNSGIQRRDYQPT